MRLDVWSDVVCPWCWLGYARLGKALESFAQRGQPRDVEVVFRSFQLDASTPKDLDIPTDELLQKKFGVGRAQIDAMHERLRALGQAEGIDYRFERARTSNTFDAHQVMHLARAQGKAAALTSRLFRANFQEGVRIGDRKELVRVAAEEGLEGAEVEAALDEQRFAPAVRADQAEAQSLGVSGVPFFLADRKLAVSGAQSVEVLGKMLGAAWERRTG